jgi:hypothetical protein
MEGIFIPITFFGMIAAIVILPRYFKSLERQRMAEALKVAIEHGQTLSPDTIDALSVNARNIDTSPNPARDLRTGIIWLGVGLGFAAMGMAIGFGVDEPDALYPFLGMSAFPIFIGLAFILLSVLNKRKV